MRQVLCLFLLLAATCPAHAQPKPNTLTPKEIADGWILLFDGETLYGLNSTSAEIKKGVLLVGGPKRSSVVLDSMAIGEDFELRFDVRGKCSGFQADGLSRRRKIMNSTGQPFEAPEWITKRIIGHAIAPEDDGPCKSGRNTIISNLVDGQWQDIISVGHSGVSFFQQFTFEVEGNERLEFRNIKLRCNCMKPIFDGEGLCGWKTFPGDKYKSKFAVVDNAINVKNGPGDLQTVGKYKDFILQLECKSNGKHLNSGIFFRCRDNEYQNGYECQIRNQFTEKPTQKYTIEDFDPMTNKLLGKREVMSTAVDYGTGAIYRRVPARKEMAKDGEWFGMTIVAHGNHFATWVNGVQVVDWTDNRPRDDNARKGCCLNAGHISIQGHDPTTDLSFRNIRIAEFK